LNKSSQDGQEPIPNTEQSGRRVQKAVSAEHIHAAVSQHQPGRQMPENEPKNEHLQ